MKTTPNGTPALVKLLRPEQWTKNLFVFIPAFFKGELFDASTFVSSLVCFAGFSLAASGVYCVNDICDAEADRLHPEKRGRPVASGAVSTKTACVAAAACLLLSMTVLSLFGGNTVGALIALTAFYCVMNIAYCVRLKRYPIIDVVIIALGFVLRVWGGGAAAGIAVTEWVIIMTFLLALFLGLAKRRDDAVRYEDTGVSYRKSVDGYTPEFLNQAITIVAAVTIVAYFMYTLSPDVMGRFNSRYLYTTGIFVLMGIIRYLQITIVDRKSGSPANVMLTDRFIRWCIAGWIGLFMLIIYRPALFSAELFHGKM